MLKDLLRKVGAATQKAAAQYVARPAVAGSPPAHHLVPPSATLQRLADPDVAAEARRCIGLLGDRLPTAEQWGMILAPTSSTCVLAGAGSGKSTTLVLRVLVMHKVLGFPLASLHVFSFTRASAQEFREKLTEKLVVWEERVETHEVDATRRAELARLAGATVTTYHRVLAQLKRSLPPAMASASFFEFHGDRPTAEEDGTMGDTYLRTRLSEAQLLLLRTVHARAYARSSRYRDLIEAIRSDEERRLWIESWASKAPPRSEEERWAWQRLIARENPYHCMVDGNYAPPTAFPDSLGAFHVDPYRACLSDWFYRRGVQAVPMQQFVVPSPKSGWEPGRFRAAFVIGDLFLHVNRHPADELRFHERDRQRHIVQFAPNAAHHRFLSGQRDFVQHGNALALTPDADLRLQVWLGLHAQAELTDAPTVRLKLPGDIREMHLFELLYQEGMFIESLGLEVGTVTSPGTKTDTLTSRTLELLGIFWAVLGEVFAERGLVRFHDVLSVVGDRQQVRNMAEQFEGLRHLLVDEFQDISPEVVHWLQTVLAVNAERGEVSFTGIGDDYQSIYGWRGSNPSFIIDYSRYFSSTEIGYVSMDDNFRSRQEIIDAAEAVLAVVRHKTDKHGHSAVHLGVEGVVYPVRLADGGASWAENGQTGSLAAGLAAFLAEVLLPLDTAGALSGQMKQCALSVLVLARTNEALQGVPAPAVLGPELLHRLNARGIHGLRQVTVRSLTFHSAKGLEADFVLLLEDSLPPEEHPLRNLVYQQTGLPGTYSENQRDESRRLAYVALTRARLGLVWVPVLRSRSAQEGSDPPRPNDAGCYVMVRRHLERVAPAAIRRPRKESSGAQLRANT